MEGQLTDVRQRDVRVIDHSWCMNQNTIAASRAISTSTAASVARFSRAVRPPSDLLFVATTQPPAFVSVVTGLSQMGAF